MIARFGPCELDLDRVELRVEGELVAVEPQVFSVLAYLIENRERVVAKEELLDELWDDRFVSESALTSRIKSVRRAVGDDGRAQGVIKTTHGRGYQFVARVEFVEPTRTPARPADRPTDPVDDSWPLVGRHHVLDDIERALADPDLCGVVITGPAGIGKTRLARDGVERARALGWRTEHIRPAASGRTVPLSGVAHLLPADLVDEDGPDSELTQAVVFARARAALQSIGSGRRFALFVDDCDQLDHLSRSLVSSLIESGSVFAVMTERRTQGGPVTFGELVASGHLLHIPLQPLDESELESLLFRVLEGPIDLAGTERLTSLAQGRPGALRQIVESALATRTLERVDDVWRVVGPIQIEGLLLGPGPASISDLGPAARAGAELLAVARDLDLVLATEMIGDDALDEMDRAGLLALGSGGAGPRVSIAHAHVARLLEDGLGRLRALRLKRRLVAVLSGPDATPVDRQRVVRWSVETGGSPSRADVIAAARLAVDADDDEAAEILLDHLDATDPGSDALSLRADLRFWQGRLADAARAADAVDPDELEASDATAAICRRSAIAFHTPGGQRDAVALLESALGGDATTVDPVLAGQWVVFQSMLGEVDEVLSRADDLIDRGPATPELRVGIAEALRLGGQVDSALELLIGSVDDVSSGDDVDTRSDRGAGIAVQIDCHLTRGDVAAALGLIRDHLPAGGRSSSPVLPRAAARAQLLAGRPRAAAALAAVPIAPRRGPVAVHADAERAATLAQVHARLGDRQVATRRAEEALAGIDGLVGQPRWSVVRAVADAWMDLGQEDDALALVMPEIDDAAAAGAVVTVAEMLALAAAAGGADEVVSRLAREAAAIEGSLWPIRVSEARARAAGNDGDALAEVAAAYRELNADGLAARADGSDAVGVAGPP